MTLVVERELLDRMASRTEIGKLGVECPLSITTSTRNGRYFVVVRSRIVRHSSASSRGHFNGDHCGFV
ncbi:hypothetical protein FK85_02225 [Halorubrum saccharovorum]|uniref:Uncharacterized protein n=1 Tax=Halorubrum saccharovorum TaxID=2248 RepID=A0A081EVI7_9EURY|nr:hypothetical protein FK85_02225 [Halorubrum saccharovorum]